MAEVDGVVGRGAGMTEYLEPVKAFKCGCGIEVLCRVGEDGLYTPVDSGLRWVRYEGPECKGCADGRRAVSAL